MIRSLLIEIRRIVVFRWVRGHQDSIKSYEQLPRVARLNIDADYLAARYRLRGKLQSMSTVDHHPAQRISISIMGKRLTAQYDECIRFHINGYHLKQYMQDRKKWRDDNTWNMIDMGSFGQHFKRLTPSQQTSHMKFVHDQLPLGTRRFQISSSKDNVLKTCPCCGNADKDSHHLVRCHSNSFMKNSGLHTLRRSPNEGSHPLRRILVGGTTHWIHTGTSAYREDLEGYPEHMKDTITRILHEQELIGWDNALKGFLSKSWMDLASMRYDDSSIDRTEGAHRLRRSTIRALYVYTTGVVWRARNSALHESEHDLNRRLHSNMHDTILQLHRNPDQICFDDRYLCDMPLETLLKSSAATQRRWIKKMRDSQAMYTRLGEQQTLITSFFSRRK
ncbi:hypothetical protein MHU86_8407 [Fragilaria crotonensis]|nr:hypothetical protein MHU86_8407 [Fragilaria crotonensis]